MRKNTVVSLISSAIAAVVLLGAPLTAGAQDNDRRNVLFTQRDQVLEFHLDFGPTGPIGGHGVETGTVSGAIEGTTLTNFKFVFPNLNNRVGITDLDGDRVIFKKVGTGVPVPPLVDPTADGTNIYQVFGDSGSAFVLTGTYEVVATTGKYNKRFRIGDKYPFRSIATNPSMPPATLPLDYPFSIVPGTEYVEVYSNRVP